MLKEYDSISDCATDEISALQGALFLAASIYEQKLPKLHKNLADWALKQISLSTIECEEDSPLKVKMPFSEAEKSYFLRVCIIRYIKHDLSELSLVSTQIHRIWLI